MCVIDSFVPECVHMWAHSQLEMCGVVFLISVIAPVFILAATPLLIVLFRVQVRPPLSRYNMPVHIHIQVGHTYIYSSNYLT